MKDHFGASDNAKSLIEQPANEQAVLGLEGTSSVGGKKAFAMGSNGQNN